MSETVVFSQLSRKFMDENDATPAEAQQVGYYSLAIGHHLGAVSYTHLGIGGAVGSLYTAAAGFTVLTGTVGVSGALSLVSYDVQISPLNAIWLITLCLLYTSFSLQGRSS